MHAHAGTGSEKWKADTCIDLLKSTYTPPPIFFFNPVKNKHRIDYKLSKIYDFCRQSLTITFIRRSAHSVTTFCNFLNAREILIHLLHEASQKWSLQKLTKSRHGLCRTTNDDDRWENYIVVNLIYQWFYFSHWVKEWGDMCICY